MDALLDTLAANPLLAAGAIALVLMVVFAIVKKLMKLALVTGVVFVALMAWSFFTGNEPGDAVRAVGQGVKTGVKKGAKATKDTAVKGVKKVGEEIEDGVKKSLD